MKMASNGRLGLRSGSHSFLIIGLSLVIVVLLYSYWSVSSRNSMLLRDQSLLQDRLRVLSSQKIKVEQKYSAARTQMTDVERTKRKLEEKDLTSTEHKTQLESKIKELEDTVRVEKVRFRTAKKAGDKGKIELLNLKNGIDTTNKKFKDMNGKANSLMTMHQKLQDKLKALSHELLQVKNDREVLQVQLDQAKGEGHRTINKPRQQLHVPSKGTPQKPHLGKKTLGNIIKFNRFKQKDVVPNTRIKVGERGQVTNTSKPSIGILFHNSSKDKMNVKLDSKLSNTLTPNLVVSPTTVTSTTGQLKQSNSTTDSSVVLEPTTKTALPINATKSSNTSVIGQKTLVTGTNLDAMPSNASETRATHSSSVVTDKALKPQRPNGLPTRASVKASPTTKTHEEDESEEHVEEEENPRARQVAFQKRTRFGQQEE